MKKFIAGAASLMLCMGLHAQDFRINPSGYFENGGANVMVFSDVYPEGHQGGLTLVLNGDRRAANGDVRFEISQGQWQGLPLRDCPRWEAGWWMRLTMKSVSHWVIRIRPNTWQALIRCFIRILFLAIPLRSKARRIIWYWPLIWTNQCPSGLPASWALIWNWYLPLCWASRGLWTTGRESFPTRRWGPPWNSLPIWSISEISTLTGKLIWTSCCWIERLITRWLPMISSLLLWPQGKSLYSILRMIWQRLRLKVRKETCCCMMEG